jgi:hypothetical protein
MHDRGGTRDIGTGTKAYFEPPVVAGALGSDEISRVLPNSPKSLKPPMDFDDMSDEYCGCPDCRGHGVHGRFWTGNNGKKQAGTAVIAQSNTSDDDPSLYDDVPF